MSWTPCKHFILDLDPCLAVIRKVVACARTAVRRDPPFPSTQELRLPFFVAVSAPGSLPGGFNLFFLPLPVPVPSRASRRALVVRAPRLDSAPTSTSSRTALPPPATGSSSTSSVWSAHVSFLFGVRRVRGRASAGGRCSRRCTPAGSRAWGDAVCLQLFVVVSFRV